MWPNPQLAASLVTFTEEIVNGKLHFLCSVLKITAALVHIRWGIIDKSKNRKMRDKNFAMFAKRISKLD